MDPLRIKFSDGSQSRSTAAVETGIFTWRTRQRWSSWSCPLDLVILYADYSPCDTGWVLWPSAANYRESLKISQRVDWLLVCSRSHSRQSRHSIPHFQSQKEPSYRRGGGQVGTRCDWWLAVIQHSVHTIIHSRPDQQRSSSDLTTVVVSSLYHSSSSSPIASSDAP